MFILDNLSFLLSINLYVEDKEEKTLYELLIIKKNRRIMRAFNCEIN